MKLNSLLSMKDMTQKMRFIGFIFIGYIYKINTPQFNLVIRNQYGNGYVFKH